MVCDYFLLIGMRFFILYRRGKMASEVSKTPESRRFLDLDLVFEKLA